MDSFDGFSFTCYAIDTDAELFNYNIKKIEKLGNIRDTYSIVGLTEKRKNEYSKDTIPVSCMVSIFDGNTRELLKTVYSNDDGYYEFNEMKSDYIYYISSYINDEVITNYFET